MVRFETTVLELARKWAQLKTISRCCQVWFKPVNDVASWSACGSGLPTYIKSDVKCCLGSICWKKYNIQQLRLFFTYFAPLGPIDELKRTKGQETSHPVGSEPMTASSRGDCDSTAKNAAQKNSFSLKNCSKNLRKLGCFGPLELWRLVSTVFTIEFSGKEDILGYKSSMFLPKLSWVLAVNKGNYIDVKPRTCW